MAALLSGRKQTRNLADLLARPGNPPLDDVQVEIATNKAEAEAEHSGAPGWHDI